MKTVLLLFLSIYLLSCNETNVTHYSYSNKKVLPDSLKSRADSFSIKMMQAVDQHLTAGDYEDPEDVLAQAEQQFLDRYGIIVDGLYVDYFTFIPYYKLPKELIPIYNRLKKEEIEYNLK